MASQSVTQSVTEATWATFNALLNYEVPFAFCGTIAYYLYGETFNPPQNIEVMLLSPTRVKVVELKQAIASEYSANFHYATSSKILRYRKNNRVKLTSGISILFQLSPSRSMDCSHTPNGFPLVPYSFLLLQKLRQWDDIPILDQLKVAVAREILSMLHTFSTQPELKHYPLFDPKLQADSVDRVRKFFDTYPDYRKEWQQMEFLTSSTPLPTLSASSSKRLEPTSTALNTQDTRPIVRSNAPLIRPVNLTSKGPVNANPPDRVTHSVVSSNAAPARLATPAPKQPANTDPKQKKTRTAAKKLTFMEIRRLAAQTTVNILREHGFHCAIFGSMACKLYGNKRIPHDVDILVLPSPEQASITQEELKALIVEGAATHDTTYSYILKPSRNPEALYKVLYFLPTPNAPTTMYKSSKVDILLPGIMHLPALPHDLIKTMHTLPLVPFPVLLLQKLQGWDDHRSAEEERYQAKVGTDVDDLQWCVVYGTRGDRMIKKMGSGVWSDRRLFSEEFEDLSRDRVKAFCDKHPKFRWAWRELGFEVV